MQWHSTSSPAGFNPFVFIYPMWDHESQRIGKQKCTPLGHKLHGIAEILSFIGLLLLAIVCAYLLYRRSVGTFQALQLLLIAVLVGLGLIGEVCTIILGGWRPRRDFITITQLMKQPGWKTDKGKYTRGASPFSSSV